MVTDVSASRLGGGGHYWSLVSGLMYVGILRLGGGVWLLMSVLPDLVEGAL